MIVVFTGSRKWVDRPELARRIIRSALLSVSKGKKGPHILVEGEAQGADRIARGVAEELGWIVCKEPVTNEDWWRIGRSAGIIRNRRMLDYIKPLRGDRVIALPYPGAKNRGTNDCINEARRRKLTVLVYTSVRKVEALGKPRGAGKLHHLRRRQDEGVRRTRPGSTRSSVSHR